MKKTLLFLVTFLCVYACTNKSSEIKRQILTENQISNYSIASDSFSYYFNKDTLNFHLPNYPFRQINDSQITYLYEQNNFACLWLEEEGLNENAWVLLNEISNAYEEGLHDGDYFLHFPIVPNIGSGDDVFNDLNTNELYYLELALTWSYLTYANHLKLGRINPDTINPFWQQRMQKTLSNSTLYAAWKNKAIKDTLQAIRPQNKQYNELKGYLAKYRALYSKNVWETINSEPVSKNDSLLMWKQIAHNLLLVGDLNKNVIDSLGNLDMYSIKCALGNFQERNGLFLDSILGKASFEALNQPLSYRIQQIEINLERLRWQPESYSDEYIFVNIPEFVLHYVKNNKVEFEMRIVVGKKETQTPIFNDEMEYLIINPTWSLPFSIKAKEILPKLKKGTAFMTQNNYSLYYQGEKIDPNSINWKRMDPDFFPYKIIQEAGRKNALGTVKFIFPNSNSVYFHDTPSSSLFARAERDFSHGCIRVSRPRFLAEYLLKDKLSSEEVNAIFESKKTKQFNLSRKIPVFIVYQTAWVKNNKMHFRKDIYDYDVEQSKALFNENNYIIANN